MYERRLLRKIVRQAVECGKGVWVKNMATFVGEFDRVQDQRRYY